MSYAVEWMGGGALPVSGIVLLLLIVPEFAAIAVVVATIAVLVGLVALAAAAFASPYLLARAMRRRRPERKQPATTRIPQGDALARRGAGRAQPSLRPAPAQHGRHGGAA
jgi:hypothetical protein